VSTTKNKISNGSMTPEEKSRYNRRDYLRRKRENQKPLNKFKTRLTILVELASKKTTVEGIVLGLLVVVMTSFLISETSKFFEEVEGIGRGSWLQYAIWELLSLVLTYCTATSRVLDIGRKILLIALCFFNIWVVSGRQFNHGSHQYLTAASAKTTIGEIERELKEKENLRSQYFEKGWLSAARKFDQSIDKLHQTLQIHRDLLNQVGSPIGIVNSMWIAIVSRLLILLTNLWCVKRLSEIIKAPKVCIDAVVRESSNTNPSQARVSETTSIRIQNRQTASKKSNVLKIFNGQKGSNGRFPMIWNLNDSEFV
jgi:hypothetical protein